MKSKLRLAVEILTLIIILVMAYRLALGKAQFLPQPYRQILSQINFRFQTIASNFADIFYPSTYWYSQLVGELPQLNLNISAADLKILEDEAKLSVEKGYTEKNSVSTQAITIVFENQEYPASISFHGGGANDFIFNKNDYNVKIKGKNTLAGYASFNLFNPSVHHWIVPQLARQVADRLELLANDQFPVLVKINHKTSGIYLLEEKINSDFLEKRGLIDAAVIKLRDETRLRHRDNPVALDAHILSAWDWEIANVDPPAKDSARILGRLDRFFRAVKDQDFERLNQLIDLDYWARFDAYRQIIGANHDTVGANLIMLYLPNEDKFYPVARSEGDSNPLVIAGGSSLKSYNNYDQHLVEQYAYPRLFLWLNRQTEFRIKKYTYLQQVLSQQKALLEKLNGLYRQTAPVFIYDTSDEASAWQKRSWLKNSLNLIEQNLTIISREVNFAQVALNAVNRPGKLELEIIPDSLMPVGFESLELILADGTKREIATLINQANILSEFSPDYTLLSTPYSFTIAVPVAVTEIKFKVKNLITGAIIDDVYYSIATD